VPIPFSHTVPEEERDERLRKRLQVDPGNRSAILAWAVDRAEDDRQVLAERRAGTGRALSRRVRAAGRQIHSRGLMDFSKGGPDFVVHAAILGGTGLYNRAMGQIQATWHPAVKPKTTTDWVMTIES
jgi:hypothetical protein